MNKKHITIKQIGSPIRRPGRQREYLKSLGLGKMNRVKTLPDSPSVRSLIQRMRHMVEIVEG